MHRLLQGLLALPHCVGCGVSGIEWCPTCAAVEPDLQWHLLANTRWSCTAFPFIDPVRSTIIAWKEHQRAFARQQVTTWFEGALVPLLDREVICVPVPSPPRNDRLRGSRMLLDVLRSIGIPVTDALRSARPRRDQAGLSRPARYENLRDAFEWRSHESRPIVIVDDVVTSGATIRAAVDAVRGAGGDVRGAFGLARRGHLGSVLRADVSLRLS